MALKSEQDDSVNVAEFDRACTELASFLYQKYRELKQEQQILESVESVTVDDTCY